jgi:hypothetical protein
MEHIIVLLRKDRCCFLRHRELATVFQNHLYCGLEISLF